MKTLFSFKDGTTRKNWSLLAFFALVLFVRVELQAQITRTANHLSPSGKGWPVTAVNEQPVQGTEDPSDLVDQPPSSGTAKAPVSNGIVYHGGHVMSGNLDIYFIWYGNWSNGPKRSDSQLTVSLLDSLYGRENGLGSSGYARINSTYYDRAHTASSSFYLVQSAEDAYSHGKNLGDDDVQAVVANAIESGRLPKNADAIYFVLTSSDVSETSGFCHTYCGWHDHTNLLDADIKYAFVGNPDRCPRSCEAQTLSPNGDSGADGMASVMAHETDEVINDPDLDGWYDATGTESADKCSWMWGQVHGTIGYAAYNQTFGTHNWLIQLNWENDRGGGCSQSTGGRFFNH